MAVFTFAMTLTFLIHSCFHTDQCPGISPQVMQKPGADKSVQNFSVPVKPSFVSERSTPLPTTDNESNEPTETADLLDHFNYCTSKRMGEGIIGQNNVTGMDIWYQCEGPIYDDFAQELHELVEGATTWSASKRKPKTWGHRAFPIPANKSVLFFGNSNTRQIALNLACQMPGLLDVHHFEFDMIDPNMAVRFRFENGASLYVVVNSYVAYSPDWQALVERQIEKPITEFDLFIMGIFNVAKGKSNFMVNLKHMTESLPYNFDLKKNPPGPSPGDVMNVYDGPFLLISNAAINQRKVFTAYMAETNDLGVRSGRPDRKPMDARKYIKILGHEGASASKLEIQDAIGKEILGANRFHRCVGDKGGHPDLLGKSSFLLLLVCFLHQKGLTLFSLDSI